ncbi:MAG: tetratricopeptide repeat protein [Chloroflexota bacterium]
MSKELEVGTSLLGKYRIEATLGRGGFGQVYKATDLLLGRTVAIKTLSQSQTTLEDRMGEGTFDRYLARFRREATVSAFFTQNRNIITVYGLEQDDETFYLVLEYLEGGSLADLLKERPILPIKQACQITLDICNALTEIHQHPMDIVHRDLKPSNILLRKNGQAVVADFGIAQVGQESERSTYANQRHPGSLAYKSPEQASGYNYLTPASDLYSLGLILYQMVTGRLYAKVRKFPTNQFNGQIPTWLDELVLKFLQEKPEARYQEAEEVARLIQVGLGEPGIAQGTTFGPPVGQPTRTTLPRAITPPNSELEPTRAMLTPVRSNPTESALPLANLPAQLTNFIGREDEVRAVQSLLQKPEVRLLTLTGPGGMGKTRLALEVVSHLQGYFENGVCFISLDGIATPEVMPFAIARALGVKETGKQTLLEILKDYLQAKQILLVLDNFEHLLAGASLVKELLIIAPRLKILVTSRAILHLYGEYEFSLLPLALPDPNHLPPLEVLEQVATVNLFVQRATNVKHNFALDKNNAQAVAEICIRLEGLPLAIELAAARIKLFTPSKILSRLVNSLQELAGNNQDLPVRQQSLRATIAWSYNLLSEDEKLLFRRLAVFAGICSVEAIEQVCNADKTMTLDLLTGLISLLDKSLLKRLDDDSDEPEFVMLDIIRDYALERLMEKGESANLKRQHALYFAEFAELALTNLQQNGSDQGFWLNRLEREHNNLRASLTFALNPDRNVTAEASNEQGEIGLRLGRVLSSFWIKHGHLSEGRQWLEALLSRPTFVDTKPELIQFRAELARGAGTIAYIQGDYSRARTRYGEAMEVWRQTGDKRNLLTVLNNIAIVENLEGHYEQAKALLEESLTVARELGNKSLLSANLNNLGNLVVSRGDYALATSLYEESLKLLEEVGDRGTMAQPLSNLGLIAQKQGDYKRATHLLEARLAIGREMGDKQGIANALNNLGIVACRQDQWQKAETLYLEGLEIWQGIGYKQGVAAVKNNLGTVACQQSNYQQASRWFCQSLSLYQALGNQNGIAHALVGLANIAAVEGRAQQAVSLTGAAQKLLDQTCTLLDPIYQAIYERTLALTRAKLDAPTFEAAWNEGQTTLPDLTTFTPE